MKESRSYYIQKRVFQKKDLIELAELFYQLAVDDKEHDKKLHVVFHIGCYGGISYDSDDPEIFKRNEILDYKKMAEVEMNYYGDNSSMSLSLQHGDNELRNVLRISGHDTAWVSESFTKLKELIDGCQPQKNWFLDHRSLLHHLLAIGIGSILFIAIDIIFNFLNIEISEPSSKNQFILFLKQNPLVFYIMDWFFRWVAGYFWAGDIIRWLFELWPAIEFDMGPEHLKKEKIFRKRIATVLTLIIIPILISIIKDYMLN